MYKHNQKQLEFEEFNLPFDDKLRSDNHLEAVSKSLIGSKVRRTKPAVEPQEYIEYFEE